MNATSTEAICVIIAAKNAAGTIGDAIRSALREPEVAEVVVVDDGSSDDTALAASRADDRSGRLNVVSFSQNRGPSAARNHAIAVSRSPLIAILDADDFFFPGRFRPMLREQGWDLIADNIAFIHGSSGAVEPARFEPRPRRISLVEFIEGNISKRGLKRGEIGFLKPVIRRSFLEAHGLRYNEDLRLGEDYEFYVQALAKGARYTVIEHCGYGAIVRHDSLSGRHRTEDLRRLYEADRALLSVSGLLSPEGRAAIARHEKHIRERYELRAFLDTKAQSGKAAAIAWTLRRPMAVPAIATGILSDKLEALRKRSGLDRPAPTQNLRYLLPGVPATQK
jgi:succinoglycan biosynthesis protein ExoU